MIRNWVRTCDLCHKAIPLGHLVQRNAEPDGLDLLMILVENQGEDLELEENSDGTVALDTCMDCATRMTVNHSYSLN